MTNDILAALAARKSVRAFTPEPVSPAQRRAILQAALQAPTAGNQTLYTILDITDGEKKQRLSQLCDHQPFIAAAPLVLMFLADGTRWHRAYGAAGCAPRPQGLGDALLAMADACIAAQNAVTAAESLGLGSCYIGDVLENREQMRALLALPPCVFPAAMLVIGHPTAQQKQRPKPPRFAPEDVVCENTYRALPPEAFADALARREGPAARASTDYTGWLQAFCARKFNSDFSREMSRSAAGYLADFAPEGEGRHG